MENNIKSEVDNYMSDSRIQRLLALRALRNYLVKKDGPDAGLSLFGGFVEHSRHLTIVPLSARGIESGAKVVKSYSLTDRAGKIICKSDWGVTERGLSGTLVASALAEFMRYLRGAYNLEADDGPLHTRYAAAAALLQYAAGGRKAASAAEKTRKKAAKAVAGLSPEQLAALLSPEQLAALLSAANNNKSTNKY